MLGTVQYMETASTKLALAHLTTSPMATLAC